MEVINTVVGKMVEVLIEHFLASMGRRISYVVHYKKNIEELDAKVQNLKGVRGRIEGKVDTARNNGEVIESDVLNWITDVNKKEEDLNRLLVDRENIKSCFHVRSRYRLGKKGKKLVSDVSGLIKGGGKFDTVGHPTALVDIWYTSTTSFEPFESREFVHKQIIEVLKDDKNYKVGIYGMAGTGKTRMVEEIAKQAQSEKLFDEVAKVVFSQNPNLKIIQTELAVCLNMSFRTEIEVGRKGELCNRLKNGKKILVIIDDVWSDEIKLEEIGIPSSDNHTKGCKVLLTSRREDVCIKMGVQENFLIGLLQEYEAWDLFKKTVGNFIESPHEIYAVAKQVCRECNGLPLAILVVGATLSNQKEKHAWDDALVQLSNCKGYNIEGLTEKLYSRIEWSYTYLKQPDFRSCFLYCSLFPEDAEIPIDDLVMYGVATRFLKDNSYTMKTARDRILVLVDTLKKSHLLLESKKRDFVKMHDVIRDVAISIASKEGFLAETGVPKWLEKDEYESHKVISLRSKNICELPHELECSELRTLILECDTCHKPQVLDSFFRMMEKLEVLDLRCLRLPTSLLNLTNLRMLSLYDCGQVNLAFLKELRNLEILKIVDYDLKQVVVEVGQLTSLRWLDWRSCTKLRIIPSGIIKRLSNIEELYMPYNFREWGDEGNVGLDELNSLTRLTNLQIHIGDGMVLPSELCFKLLNRFKISTGRICGFEYGEENLGAKMLRLDDITLRREFNILMEKADVLFLKGMESLKNVLHFGDRKGFLDLKYLKIEDCSDMEHLLGRPKGNLQTQGSFSKLNVLIVKNCTLKFLFFPSMARALMQLQELDICDCEIMEEIIFHDEKMIDKVIFRQLRKMTLENLPILISICANTKKTSTTKCSTSTDAQALFNEKVSFPELEELHISGLDSITAIWDNQLFIGPEAEEEFFWPLRRLEIEMCKKLENVIPSNLIPRLQNLEFLEVECCDLVVSAIDVLTIEKGFATTSPTIELPRLQLMRLQLLPKLMFMGLNRKEHSDHKLIGAYSNLTSLDIISCHSLRNVFSSSIARNLRQLQYLTVSHCKKIEEIIGVESRQGEEEVTNDGIIVFPQLKNMKLEMLPILKSFCSGSKKAGVENDIPQVQALFSHKVKFPSLEEFYYKGSKNNVKEIWNCTVRTDSFCKLKRLRVFGCDELLSVATSKLLGSFQNLEELYIYECPSLEEIFKVERRSNNAEQGIVVARDKDIEEELETISELPSLVTMRITCCPKLKSAAFYVSKEKVSISFPRLKFLSIDTCHSLRNVFSPSMARNLRQLQDLIVINCEKIEEIIAVETVQGEEEVRNDEIIVFPQLKKIKLEELPILKSFSSWSNKEAVEDDIPQVQALFNYKVKFPSLEELFYKGSKNKVKEIWNSTLQTDSFCRLKRLTVDSCDELLSIASSKLIGSFQNLEELYIYECSTLEEIFKVEGMSNNAEQGIVVAREVDKDIEKELEAISELSSLVTMRITCCPKLKSAGFYVSKKKVAFPVLENLVLSDGGIIEDICYGHVPAGSFCKVRKLEVSNCSVLVNVSTLLERFEALEELSVYNCSTLEVVFNLEGLEDIERGATLSYRIKNLTVIGCHNLKYLFSLPMARNLTKIEDLTVESCDAIEEIIRKEDQGEEDGTMNEIVFPKLKSMEFKKLTNLTSFCWANNAFKLPSLWRISLSGCHKMQTFTSGQISTPVIQLYDGSFHETSDINDYVQQQRLQEMKGRTTYNDDEETSLGKEIEKP